MPAYLSPLLLIIFLLLCLLNPFKFAQYRARRWLIRELVRVASAPFFEVKFADFWLGDQLNSMSFIIPDLAFFFCFYASQISWRDGLRYVPLTSQTNSGNMSAIPTVPQCSYSANLFKAQSCQCSGLLFGLDPILRILPAWFRFAQCLRRYRDMRVKKLSPHVVNAGKYATTFVVRAFDVWNILDGGTVSLIGYLLARIAQSTYTYSWDIRMDWGLLEWERPYRLLREEMVYQSKAYYYIAIVEDFVLRFAWSIRVGIEANINCPPELMSTIFLTLEVFRRFIWNFFRLENEHLNNCGEFRAVRDIFIRPERRETVGNASNINGIYSLSLGRKFKRKGSDDNLKAYENPKLHMDADVSENKPPRREKLWHRITKLIIGRRKGKTNQEEIDMVDLSKSGEKPPYASYVSSPHITRESGSILRSTDHIHRSAHEPVYAYLGRSPRPRTPPPRIHVDQKSRSGSVLSSVVTLKVPCTPMSRRRSISSSSISDKSSSPSLRSKEASWDSVTSSERDPVELRENPTITTLLMEDPDRPQPTSRSMDSVTFPTSSNQNVRPKFSTSSHTSLDSTAPYRPTERWNRDTCERVVIIPRDYTDAPTSSPPAKTWSEHEWTEQPEDREDGN